MIIHTFVFTQYIHTTGTVHTVLTLFKPFKQVIVLRYFLMYSIHTPCGLDSRVHTFTDINQIRPLVTLNETMTYTKLCINFTLHKSIIPYIDISSIDVHILDIHVQCLRFAVCPLLTPHELLPPPPKTTGFLY